MTNPITEDAFMLADETIDNMINNRIPRDSVEFQKCQTIVSDYIYFSRKERESSYVEPHYPNCEEGSIFDY